MRRLRILALVLGALSPCATTAEAEAVSPVDASLIRKIIEVPRIDSIIPSADGKLLAFRVIKRSLSLNSTSLQWYMMRKDGSGKAVPLGTREHPIWIPLFDFIEDGQAAWMPDGRSVLVKELVGHEIQIHEIGPDGRDQAITRDSADVESFKFTPWNGLLEYQTRSSRALIDAQQRNQQISGIPFNRSVFSEGLPLTHNFRIGSRETTIRTVAASTGQEAFAGELVRHSIHVNVGAPIRSDRQPSSASLDLTDAKQLSANLPIKGARVSAEPTETGTGLRLQARLDDGRTVVCEAKFCSGDSSALRQVIRGPRSGEVIILYEQDYSARTGIYGWTPATGALRTLTAPTKAIDGGSSYRVAPCPVIGASLVCAASAADEFPHLISVDLDSGAMRALYAPSAPGENAELLRNVGEIRFLQWRGADNRPSNGILFLPKNPRPNLPLVITTPRCRGFLTGGGGNLTPEIVLASQGIAALCVNNDNGVPFVSVEEDSSGAQALSMHKAAISSWSAIIDELSGQGIIDRQRVGVSGHSYTSMVAAYAISHTNLFAAASLGTGITIDPMDYYLMAAPANSWRKLAFSSVGLPTPANDPRGVWKQISPSLNASRIKANVLIQPPETEYLLALQLYGSIEDSGGNVAMFVYPDEGHGVERFPSHIFWRMYRSVNWFRNTLEQSSMTAMNAPKPQHQQLASHVDNRSLRQ